MLRVIARCGPTLAAICLLAVPLACGGSSPQTSSSGSAPVTVPLRVRGGQGSPRGAVPTVAVKVGNGPAIRVLLDTGSVGLHVYAPGVARGAGSGVSLTTRTSRVGYVDGSVQTGVIANARITIGGVTTPQPIPFGLITTLGCVRSKPNCPARAGMAAAVRRGAFGTLGVRLVPVRPGLPSNPLVQLSAPYSNAFSISLAGSGGTLTLGAAAPSKPVAVLVLHNLVATACWTIGSISNVCANTLFDSGNAAGLQLFGGRLAQAPTAPASSRVLPGTPVSAALPGRSKAFWSFTAGTTSSKNTVHAHPRGRGTVNTSSAAFFAFLVTFDAVRQKISLSAPSG